jgi:hypothetical protein
MSERVGGFLVYIVVFTYIALLCRLIQRGSTGQMLLSSLLSTAFDCFLMFGLSLFDLIVDKRGRVPWD